MLPINTKNDPISALAAFTTPGMYHNAGGAMPSDAPSNSQIQPTDDWKLLVRESHGFVEQMWFDVTTSGIQFHRFSLDGGATWSVWNQYV